MGFNCDFQVMLNYSFIGIFSIMVCGGKLDELVDCDFVSYINLFSLSCALI